MMILPVSTLASLLFFGSITISYVVYRAFRLVRPSATLAVSNSQELAVTTNGAAAPSKLREGLGDGEKSLEQLGRAGTELGLLALVTWLCENKPVFPHASKIHDVDFFWFIILTAFLVSFLFTVHVAPKDQGILNRDQTEEWRGFMQLIFLLYHYFALEEVYPLIRLFISCYVFLTGFGNTSFFYLKRDYSTVRLLSMLWRLTFSCLVLAMVHNNPIILYYIVPLHTFYFLVSYVTMSLFEQRVNYTKHGLKLKLVVLGLVLFVVWEFPSVFELVFSFLSNEPHPGAPVGAYGTRYEWQFRSGLDHYSSFFGMVFACGFPLLELRQSLAISQSRMIQVAVGGVCVAMILAWSTLLFPMQKLEFNARHAYTFVFPMVGYLFLRNLTPYLRRVHLGMFAHAGKYTLETYLLQHHVWLTSNAKTVLVLLPGLPNANFVFTSALYFMLSVKLYDLTVKTKLLLIPSHDPKGAVTNIVVLAGAVGLCLGLAQFVTVISDGTIEALLTGLFLGALTLLWLSASVFFSKHSNGASDSTTASSRCLRALMLILSVAFFVVGVVCAAFPAQPTGSFAACDPNQGNWVSSFNGICGQAPQANFAFCTSRGWAWDVMEQRRCGWKRFSKLEQVDTVYLLGKDVEYTLAFVRLEDPGFAYSEKAPVSEFAKGKIVRLEHAEDLRLKTLKENTLVICQDKSVVEACTLRTGGVAVMYKNLEDDGVVEEDEASRKVYFVDVAAVKASAPKGDKLDEDRYKEDVYDVIAQITLNHAARALKKPSKASPPPPGGLAHNPLWGLLFLALAFYALFMADGYLGLAATASIAAGFEKNITWEKAMSKVHALVPGLHPDQVQFTVIPTVGSETGASQDQNGESMDDTTKLLEKA